MKYVVIDADSIAYRSAAACEKRGIKVNHIPSGKSKEFNNRTEFKAHMKTKGKEITPDYQIEDTQEPEPLANCLHTVKMQVQRIMERTEADDSVILVGAKSTYRESLPLPSKYKSNRKDMLRPIHLKDAKQYLINKFKAQEVSGIESDDAVIIHAIQLKALGHDVVVAAIDKDSNQLEDFTIYDYSKDEFKELKGHSIEKIQKEKGVKITGSGVGFLAWQCLNGDMTDGFKPTELCKVKYGEVSAYNDLKDCSTPKEFLEVVVRKYKEWYPEPLTYTAWDGKEYTKSYIEILDMYFKCAHMLSSEFDEANVKDFLDRYEVKYD